MKYLTTALLTAALTMASTLCAARSYLVYDLTNGSVETLKQEDVNPRDKTYHESAKMLFVQESSLSPDYYIGVFEVTEAQALALGWITEEKMTTPGAAYATRSNEATYQFSEHHALSAPLSFPSVEQWQAYANAAGETTFEGKYNFYWDDLYSPFQLSRWYEFLMDETKGKPYGATISPNAYGLFDIFGNVAEYTTDDHKFYGGFASTACTLYTLKNLPSHTAADISTYTNPNQNLLGARLIYTPPKAPVYGVTVTHNEEVIFEQDACNPGDEITFTEPEIPEGHHLKSCTVTPDNLEITDFTFTMPESDVTIDYRSAPYLRIRVIGGTTTQSEVFAGDTFTLSPTTASYQLFKSWTLPDKTEISTREPSFTITASDITTYGAGATLTYTANLTTIFDSKPRVLIYNGTVTCNPETGAYGEGYYDPGTELTLSAPAINGCTFKEWQKNGEVFATTATAVYTVEATTAVITFIPVYTSNTPAENTAITYIGETGSSPDSYTAKVELGYVAGDSATYTAGLNKFKYYGTKDETSPFIVLNTTNETVDYAGSEPGTAKTSSPTLKRVAVTGQPPYYVGLYETTIAHTLHLAQAAGKTLNKTERDDLENKRPQTYHNKNSSTAYHTVYFENISNVFKLSATLPTEAQITTISSEYKTGITKDTNLESANVLYHDTAEDMDENKLINAWDYADVGSKGADRYGFYDILGNVRDMFADGTLRGGGADSNLAFCKIDPVTGTTGTFPSAFPGAFRPVITVRAKHTVTIAGLTSATPLTVLPGQVINLTPQVTEGKTFVGWTAKTGDAEPITVPKAENGDIYPYTVTGDVTLTPVFKDKLITLTYKNCLGPATSIPGSTTQIYAANPGQTLRSLTLEPASAGTVNLEKGTITFSETAAGEVSITAAYGKAGYILKLK